MRRMAGNVLVGLAVLGAAGSLLMAGASVVEMLRTYPTSDRYAAAEGMLLLAGALLGLEAMHWRYDAILHGITPIIWKRAFLTMMVRISLALHGGFPGKSQRFSRIGQRPLGFIARTGSSRLWICRATYGLSPIHPLRDHFSAT